MTGKKGKKRGGGSDAPISLVSTVKASVGSVMIWDCFSWSVLGSQRYAPKKMRSAYLLNILNDQVFLDLFLFILVLFVAMRSFVMAVSWLEAYTAVCCYCAVFSEVAETM